MSQTFGCSTSAVEYLLRKGHRTVYHISGPLASQAAESRAKGWRYVLQARNIPVPPTYIGDREADSGYEARRALAHETDCTAIYAANDQMAYGAIEGLKDSGKRVPEDVSVIGVVDSLVGTVPRLSLTTMRMDFETIGREGRIRSRKNQDAYSSEVDPARIGHRHQPATGTSQVKLTPPPPGPSDTAPCLGPSKDQITGATLLAATMRQSSAMPAEESKDLIAAFSNLA